MKELDPLRPLRTESVAIIGFSETTRREAPFEDPNWERWVCNRLPLVLHNEGEDFYRWPTDGSWASYARHDFNMYWHNTQVSEFIPLMRKMLDRQGLQAVGVTPGETSSWDRSSECFQRNGASEPIGHGHSHICAAATDPTHPSRFERRHQHVKHLPLAGASEPSDQ